MSAVHTLSDLVFKPNAGEVMTASVPSHRAADLREPHDLIEEIIRLHGYDNLELAATQHQRKS